MLTEAQSHVLDEVPQSQVNEETVVVDSAEVVRMQSVRESVEEYNRRILNRTPEEIAAAQKAYDETSFHCPQDALVDLDDGATYPFDDARDENGEYLVTPARSWAHAAARGVVHRVMDINELDETMLDWPLQHRKDFIDDLTCIISAAHRQHLDTLRDKNHPVTWTEHTEHQRADWKADVNADRTQIGYWEWVDEQQATQGVT